MIDASSVAARVREVRDRIEAAGGGSDVRIVAVTKGFGPEAIGAALAAGVHDVGENYAQELVAKLSALGDGVGDGLRDATVHFIGRLQRNKVRQLAPYVGLWQSVDREPLAAEIAARAPGSAVLVQLDLSGEPGKGGCPIDGGAALVGAARGMGLDVRGLMGVGPTGPPELARAGFATLVALADELDLPVRSIGMSADLEVAVQEGSTMVRIGRDLFGPRPPRR